MAKTDHYLFDFDLGENKAASHGLAVAASIERLLEEESPLFEWLEPHDIDYLRRVSQQIRESASPPLKTRSGTHPLTSFKSDSPIYASLADDERLEYGNQVAMQLLDTARYLMLFSACRSKLSTTSQIAVCNFVHQLPNDAGSRTKLKRYIPSNWGPEAISDSKTKLDEDLKIGHVRGPRAKEMLDILSDLFVIVDDLQKSTGSDGPQIAHESARHSVSPRPSKIAVKRSYQDRISALPIEEEHDVPLPQVLFTHIAKAAEDVSARLEAELVTQEGEDPGHSEATARTFNQHGHHIRLNRAFAGMSSESLSNLETRQAVSILLELLAPTPELEAAKLIWLLVALTGRLFDDLAPAIIGGSAADPRAVPDGAIRSVQRDGHRITLEIQHIIASRLPYVTPEHQTGPVQTYFNLWCAVPSRFQFDEGWDFLVSATENNLDQTIDQLLKAKADIRQSLRQRTERFTETRLRGSTIQAAFIQDYDLPLTQLLFSERIQGSLAALHYLASPQNALQQRLNRAISDLYGDMLPAAQSPQVPNFLVGAPKAAIRQNVFDEAVSELNRLQQSLRRLAPQNITEHLNRRALLACVALGLGDAHRFTHDLADIRIHDLCLSEGLALFRDKPSDSSVFRRLTVIPSFSRLYLRQYLAYLAEIASSSPSEGLPSFARDAAIAALRGERGVFFQITDTKALPAYFCPL